MTYWDTVRSASRLDLPISIKELCVSHRLRCASVSTEIARGSRPLPSFLTRSILAPLGSRKKTRCPFSSSDSDANASWEEFAPGPQ